MTHAFKLGTQKQGRQTSVSSSMGKKNPRGAEGHPFVREVGYWLLVHWMSKKKGKKKKSTCIFKM